MLLHVAVAEELALVQPLELVNGDVRLADLPGWPGRDVAVLAGAAFGPAEAPEQGLVAMLSEGPDADPDADGDGAPAGRPRPGAPFPGAARKIRRGLCQGLVQETARESIGPEDARGRRSPRCRFGRWGGRESVSPTVDDTARAIVKKSADGAGSVITGVASHFIAAAVPISALVPEVHRAVSEALEQIEDGAIDIALDEARKAAKGRISRLVGKAVSRAAGILDKVLSDDETRRTCSNRQRRR